MSMTKKRIIVLDVVGLSLDYFKKNADDMPHIASLLEDGTLHELVPPFPAVTLPVQATMTTGHMPDEHGVVANGFYFPENFTVSFWEQAASLVQSERIWQRRSEKEKKLSIAMLFMQNSLYADCQVVMTPKPMHTDDGLISWCYGKPVGFYEELCKELGEFPLKHYWGPMAGIESSRWIAGAALKTLEVHRPDLMFVYLPHLDYSTQKFGPGSPAVIDELGQIDREVGRIIAGVDDLGLRRETVFVVLSEYAFSAVKDAVPLNRILREHGLLAVRTIKGKEYLDYELSPAFAMVDHQVAHIYCKPGFAEKVRRVLEKQDGIDFLLCNAAEKNQYRINHQRSGDIVAVSSRDKWFSYYWWQEKEKAPDFAGKVDIHRKPGYDPLELFMEPETFQIPQDTSLVKGAHGYPAITAVDYVPLLISGESSRRQHCGKKIMMKDVGSLIESLSCGAAV